MSKELREDENLNTTNNKTRRWCTIIYHENRPSSVHIYDSKKEAQSHANYANKDSRDLKAEICQCFMTNAAHRKRDSV